MSGKVLNNKEYIEWIKELKDKFRQVQIKTAIKVNNELLNFYWELGKEIVEKQKETKWGDKLIDNLSKDLQKEFPAIKGFSRRNLMYIQKWYLFYSSDPKLVQQVIALITKIPWGHNIDIITKCQNVNEALFYVKKTIQNNWSRSVLTHQIESDLYKRSGKAITNFNNTLPKPQSDLAKEMTKDPYCFDFLTLAEDYNERELEKDLLRQLKNFLIELGTGFAFIGKQYKLYIQGEEFFFDLLFYHVKLHSYVVIELKTVKFKPEFTGKLNFYISAVDSILKTEQDNSTIGILICKEKNNTIVEYSLRDISKPIGVSEYKIMHKLPKHLKSFLPDSEQIKTELNIEKRGKNER